MEEFSDVRFKQRAVIEFWTAGKVPPIEIHRRMQAVCGDQCVDVSTVRRWVSVCGDQCVDVSTVWHWVRWSLQWGNGFKNKTPFFLRTDFKNWCSFGGSVVKCVVILWKNNYAALKIIDVGIFLFFFYFVKIYFPVHFLFKWRQNLSACPRTYFMNVVFYLCCHLNRRLLILYIYGTALMCVCILYRVYLATL